MNSPLQALDSMIRDPSVKSIDRQRAMNMVTAINRVGDSITSLVNMGRDASSQYETLYNLESAAWQLIERY